MAVDIKESLKYLSIASIRKPEDTLKLSPTVMYFPPFTLAGKYITGRFPHFLNNLNMYSEVM